MSIFSLGASYIAFSVLHIILFILAIVVAALYGTDLADGEGDSRWIFAEVVAGLSALTALLYLLPFFLRFMAIWIWNLILFILWISLFGVFGKMYINKAANNDDVVRRMKVAVWIDLVSALLWLVATLAALGYWLGHRERRSRFTGRAKLY